jgi:hypothetical protein
MVELQVLMMELMMVHRLENQREQMMVDGLVLKMEQMKVYRLEN